MINRIIIVYILTIAWGFAACNNAKPKPISGDIAKTTVTLAGKKDSVINNPEKNYGNATVSEPCVKCLIGIIQATNNYKLLTTGVSQKNIIYDVNWITSSKPVNIGIVNKIINGMVVGVNLKDGATSRKLISYLYNNQNRKLYLRNDQSNDVAEEKIDSISLKKIRNSCFWGVASAK